MSWIENLENSKFTIITGDGKVFKPLWKNGLKSKDYNVSNYNFIDVEGGFTDRKKPQAGKYPLVFWFQGEDNIEQANDFEASADDSRPWTIKHPYYGEITGQPISLERDDKDYNITQVSVSFWESISSDYPNPQSSINDIITSGTQKVTEQAAKTYAARAKTTSADQQIIKESILQSSSTFDKLFDDDNFAEYQNAVSVANNKTNDIINYPEQAISSIGDLFKIPSLFSKPVIDKVNSLVSSFNKIKQVLDASKSASNKIYFESSGSDVLASMCQCVTVSEEDDYKTRVEIEEINKKIVSTYNEYLKILNDSQVSFYNVNDSYFPSSELQFSLYQLIVQTTGNLFALAFNAKQQRIILTSSETNLILLTHKYLGLASDKNIEEFRELNNIKNDKLFKIDKGTEIKYFV